MHPQDVDIERAGPEDAGEGLASLDVVVSLYAGMMWFPGLLALDVVNRTGLAGDGPHRLWYLQTSTLMVLGWGLAHLAFPVPLLVLALGLRYRTAWARPYGLALALLTAPLVPVGSLLALQLVLGLAGDQAEGSG